MTTDTKSAAPAVHPDHQMAQTIQGKFELYMLGLAFTLAGLSIQTATFNGPPAQHIIASHHQPALVSPALVNKERVI